MTAVLLQCATSLCLLAMALAVSMAQGKPRVRVPQEDEVKSLPGLKKQPSFRQFSGYLKAAGTNKLHYWFVESQNNPAVDPVVLWLNGGPGCSSDLGFLTEHGPFRVQQDGQTLLENPFSWNLVANMIYLEAPAGVGYSYNDNQNYTTDDDLTAHNNYLALKDFFRKFPDFAKNEFFVTGESYGGVYVPTLSSLVVDDPDINFQGFAVGNGLSSYEFNEDSLIYFAYYHGLIGEVLWERLITSCCHGNATDCPFKRRAVPGSDCNDAVSTVSDLVYNKGLNIYNLYGPCIKSSAAATELMTDSNHVVLQTANFGWAFSQAPNMKAERQFMHDLLRQGKSVSLTPPCISADGAIKYMNSADVRTALHIPSSLPAWSPCSVFNYNQVYKEMSAQYKKILGRGRRVMVYNGDVDMACNFLGDEWFTDRLGQPLVKARSEWSYVDETKTQQVAGFFKQFKGLTFVTVRGAGHMVPTDRPRPALKMFINFITNKPFN